MISHDGDRIESVETLTTNADIGRSDKALAIGVVGNEDAVVVGQIERRILAPERRRQIVLRLVSEETDIRPTASWSGKSVSAMLLPGPPLTTVDIVHRLEEAIPGRIQVQRISVIGEHPDD